MVVVRVLPLRFEMARDIVPRGRTDVDPAGARGFPASPPGGVRTLIGDPDLFGLAAHVTGGKLLERDPGAARGRQKNASYHRQSIHVRHPKQRMGRT